MKHSLLTFVYILALAALASLLGRALCHGCPWQRRHPRRASEKSSLNYGYNLYECCVSLHVYIVVFLHYIKMLLKVWEVFRGIAQKLHICQL